MSGSATGKSKALAAMDSCFRHPITVALAVLLSSPSASANDFGVGGSGADLVPLSETRVSMRSEDIRIAFADGHWRISADYVFVNPTPNVASLQVGFPEILCPPDVDCSAKFWNLKTTVDGQPVVHRKGTLASKHEWAKYLGTVWLFDVVFPSEREVHVTHTYEMSSDGSVDNVAGMTYVTRTGAMWASPIKRAHFSADLPIEAFAISSEWGQPKTVTPREGQRPHVRLEVTHEDWVPKHDLPLHFYFTPPVLPKLAADRLERSGIAASDECVRLPAAETPEQLQACKNLIFAISGYTFKDERLARYFYGSSQEWSFAPLWQGEPKYWWRALRELPGFEYDKLPTRSRFFLDYMEKEVRPSLKPAGLSSGVRSPVQDERAPAPVGGSQAIATAGVGATAAPSVQDTNGSELERGPNASASEPRTSAHCACAAARTPQGRSYAGRSIPWAWWVLIGVAWGRRVRSNPS